MLPRLDVPFQSVYLARLSANRLVFTNIMLFNLPCLSSFCLKHRTNQTSRTLRLSFVDTDQFTITRGEVPFATLPIFSVTFSPAPLTEIDHKIVTR